MKHVIVLGGGISGLATAWFLEKRGVKVTLIEKSERLGGWIRTEKKEEFLFECGPRGFRPKGKGKVTLKVAQELGLTPLPASRKAHKRYVWLDGKLRRFSPLLLLKCGGLGAYLREKKVSPTNLEDETIADFVTRRFNPKLLETVVDPCVKGIYAGDPAELSMRSCFPLLWEWERTHGSVIKGMRMRKKEKAFASLCSFREGMEALPRALSKALQGEVHLKTRVSAIEPHERGVTIIAGGRLFEADHVVAALPARVLASLLPLPVLSEIPMRSLATVNLGYRRRVLPKRGFGFLIPAKEKAPILGMTWDSEIFPEQNEPKQTRLCVMLAPQQHLEETALKAAQHYCGITATPDVVSTHVAEEAIPQYILGHYKRLAQLQFPRLSFTGSCFYGVGINDCLSHAAQVADEVVSIS